MGMYAAPQKQSSARVPEIVPANRGEPASEADRAISWGRLANFAWSVIQDVHLERVQEARRAKKGCQLADKDPPEKRMGHPEQARSTASCHSYNPRNRRTMRKEDSVCPARQEGA